MIQKNWQELIRPNKLQVTAGTDAARVATVVAEPLERGFGVTLGTQMYDSRRDRFIVLDSMAEHEWATALLWQGLIGPAPERWASKPSAVGRRM